MADKLDRLDPARFGWRLVVVTLGATAFLLVLTSFGLLPDSRDVKRRYIGGLNLSTPALFPTGHVKRDVSYRHPAVDLRQGPQLPVIEPVKRDGAFESHSCLRERHP